MGATNPHVTESTPGRRGGCLRSCLIATAVFVVLAVVSMAGAYILGRAYFERQLLAWEARYPALGLARDLLQLKGDSVPVEQELQVNAERMAGVDDKDQMPDDVPLYPDPLVETYSVGEDQAVGFQRIAGRPEGVLSRLRELMQQNGWELAHEQETAWGHLLVWQKGERTCQTEVVASEENTEIWIRTTG
ncbi:MAG: hypothetical protein MUQ10_05370 [Anaerolineae bacterium]|nr:hypothetical protein [Anaerolineae bacterium]